MAKSMHPNTMVKALSGAPLVWMWLPDDGTAACAIHRTFSHQCWFEDGYAGGALLAVGSLLMLPTLLTVAAGCTWRCGQRVRNETGKSIVRQFAEQVSLGCRLAVPPPWYYIFEFYHDVNRRRAVEYLYRTETKSGIYDMLRRRRNCNVTTEALRDKALFVERCQQFDVAAVEALATVENGQIQSAANDGRLPCRDLFFKPIKGAGGRGASRWFYQGNDRFEASDGRSVTRTALESHLRQLSRAERYLVRPYVRSHPDILDLSPGALSTVRVITCLDENGTPEMTHAVFRMASSADVVVDNFHAGGIAASVDRASGRLGLATDMGLAADSRWWREHPTTKATIEGRVLPDWPAVCALAVAAHAAFADQVAIGWDIAMLSDGPHLIEGNKSPDLDIIQRASQAPAGSSRLGELLALHLTASLAHQD